ncbi:MAG: Rrf2 family transcriptional regulator [Cyclobacteriaceae bacterium]|nr:Rrf2 family transcriptional regulator [Cyclobacteriaceae bacterium]
MLSNKCKYAFRAVLYLAVEGHEKDRLNSISIAESLNIPVPYMGKILQELAKKRIITSSKGPNGGFYLREENYSLPLMKIVEAIDGLDVFNQCGLGLTSCSSEHPCPIHDDFKVGRDHLSSLFQTKTIAHITEEIKIKDYFLVG